MLVLIIRGRTSMPIAIRLWNHGTVQLQLPLIPVTGWWLVLTETVCGHCGML